VEEDCDDSDPTVRPDWFTTVLDEGPAVGEYASLVIDASNSIHASYYAELSGNLRYARLPAASGVWEKESAHESDDDVGKFSSVAVAADGVAHIAYYNATTSELLHATNATGKWQPDVVETTPLGGDVGQFAAMSIDEGGTAHLAYYDEAQGALRYATDASGAWELETIHNTGQKAGMYASIAVLDSVVYVAYQTVDTLDLRVAKGNQGDWSIWEVDKVGEVGEAPSIAVLHPPKDPDDEIEQSGETVVHVAYLDAKNHHLLYAKHDGIEWNTWPIDNSRQVGPSITLTLDGHGDVHLGYHDQTNGCLRYRNNKLIGSGQWLNDELASGTDEGVCGGLSTECGDHASMVYDPRGRLHAIHYDSINKRLLYSRKACLGY